MDWLPWFRGNQMQASETGRKKSSTQIDALTALHGNILHSSYRSEEETTWSEESFKCSTDWKCNLYLRRKLFSLSIHNVLPWVVCSLHWICHVVTRMNSPGYHLAECCHVPLGQVALEIQMAPGQVVSWWGHLPRCLGVTWSSAVILLAKCMAWSLIKVIS